MTELTREPSARHVELLEAAYAYALRHGLAELSLRPLADAIGSSPRVLLYLFDSKEGLVRALLARARADELVMLHALRRDNPDVDLVGAAARVWDWLSTAEHRDLLKLWMEGYTRSLVEPTGAWSGFGERTVDDWLTVLARYQPAGIRRSAAGAAQRTLVLAVLRGALLDLLATGDLKRTTAAVQQQLATLR